MLFMRSQFGLESMNNGRGLPSFYLLRGWRRSVAQVDGSGGVSPSELDGLVVEDHQHKFQGAVK